MLIIFGRLHCESFSEISAVFVSLGVTYKTLLISFLTLHFQFVHTVQYVRANWTETVFYKGDTTKRKKQKRKWEEGREGSKSVAEPGAISKMMLEGSPSSLHPVLPDHRPCENKLIPLNYRLRLSSDCGSAAGRLHWLFYAPAATVTSLHHLIKANIKHSSQTNTGVQKKQCEYATMFYLLSVGPMLWLVE